MPRPPRRHFAEPEKSAIRDVDASSRTRMLRAGVWALAGGVLGFLGGFWLAYHSESSLAWMYPLVGIVLGMVLVFSVTMGLTEGSGKIAGTLYNPSGRSTPRKHDYSYAKSLVARGEYQEAADAFELAVAENPKDPDLYLQLARLMRDHLNDLEGAVRWFRRALRDAEPPYAMEVLLVREIHEVFAHRMKEPAKALPLLAQMAEKYPDTPEGQWAAKEMWDLKRLVAGDLEG